MLRVICWRELGTLPPQPEAPRDDGDVQQLPPLHWSLPEPAAYVTSYNGRHQDHTHISQSEANTNSQEMVIASKAACHAHTHCPPRSWLHLQPGRPAEIRAIAQLDPLPAPPGAARPARRQGHSGHLRDSQGRTAVPGRVGAVPPRPRIPSHLHVRQFPAADRGVLERRAPACTRSQGWHDGGAVS